MELSIFNEENTAWLAEVAAKKMDKDAAETKASNASRDRWD